MIITSFLKKLYHSKGIIIVIIIMNVSTVKYLNILNLFVVFLIIIKRRKITIVSPSFFSSLFLQHAARVYFLGHQQHPQHEIHTNEEEEKQTKQVSKRERARMTSRIVTTAMRCFSHFEIKMLKFF